MIYSFYALILDVRKEVNILIKKFMLTNNFEMQRFIYYRALYNYKLN